MIDTYKCILTGRKHFSDVVFITTIHFWLKIIMIMLTIKN